MANVLKFGIFFRCQWNEMKWKKNLNGNILKCNWFLKITFCRGKKICASVQEMCQMKKLGWNTCQKKKKWNKELYARCTTIHNETTRDDYYFFPWKFIITNELTWSSGISFNFFHGLLITTMLNCFRLKFIFIFHEH